MSYLLVEFTCNAFYFDLIYPLRLTCPCSSGVNSCAVEHYAPQELGSKLGLGTSTFQQRIISTNSYALDVQGDNPRQEKDGLTVSSVICDCC